MKKILPRALMIVGAIAISGGALLHTSQSVQQVEARLDQIRADIERENQGIDLLEAEWAILNSPYRLERLATDALGMEPSKASEMQTDMSCIPDDDVVPALADGDIQAQPIALTTDPCKPEVP
jgi:hypothetical protein